MGFVIGEIVRMRNAKTTQKIKKSKRNANIKKRLKGILVMCFMVALLFSTASAAEPDYTVQIIIKADDQTMTQGMPVPAMSLQVESGDLDEKQGAHYLDASGEYTAAQLVEDLKNGKGISAFCGADGKEAGRFPIQVQLSEELQNNMQAKWGSKAKIELQEGTLTVEERVVSEAFKKLDYAQPMIALTFDDGPSGRTMELLNVLEQYDAHATFFMLGQNVSKYPDAVKKMQQIGCEIGSHTFNHANLSTLDPGGIAEEIASTNDALSAIIGSGATVMRPPYGAFNDTVKANVGMPLILWSVDTLDWKAKNTQATIEHVLANTGDGDIALMHDIYDTSIDAAIQLIPKLIEQGYQLVTVSELAEARGMPVQYGESYFSFYQ